MSRGSSATHGLHLPGQCPISSAVASKPKTTTTTTPTTTTLVDSRAAALPSRQLDQQEADVDLLRNTTASSSAIASSTTMAERRSSLEDGPVLMTRDMGTYDHHRLLVDDSDDDDDDGDEVGAGDDIEGLLDRRVDYSEKPWQTYIGSSRSGRSGRSSSSVTCSSDNDFVARADDDDRTSAEDGKQQLMNGMMTAKQLQYYTDVFRRLQPDLAGVVAGEQARRFFELSELPPSELSRIWRMSDKDGDSALSLREFVVAMHLTVLAVNNIVIYDHVSEFSPYDRLDNNLTHTASPTPHKLSRLLSGTSALVAPQPMRVTKDQRPCAQNVLSRTSDEANVQPSSSSGGKTQTASAFYVRTAEESRQNMVTRINQTIDELHVRMPKSKKPNDVRTQAILNTEVETALLYWKQSLRHIVERRIELETQLKQRSK